MTRHTTSDYGTQQRVFADYLAVVADAVADDAAARPRL